MTDRHDGFWDEQQAGVSAEQVESAREEVGPEKVVCHECARALGQITEQHLRIHGMTLEEYEMEHPDAPIYPDAPKRQPGRDSGYSHTEETKQKIGERTEENHDRGVYE